MTRASTEAACLESAMADLAAAASGLALNAVMLAALERRASTHPQPVDADAIRAEINRRYGL